MYYIDFDTETAPLHVSDKPNPNDSLTYDFGWTVANHHGDIFRTRSFLIKEVWENENLMKSAYYASKIPLYKAMLERGEISLVSFFDAIKAMLEDMKQFNINTVCAHNARFDVAVLNNTIRTLTDTKYTRFFDDSITIWDSMLMAGATICKQKNYRKWCEQHNELTKNNQVRKTAQALYRYCFGDWDFEEAHTALDDAMIETQIVARCFNQHKPMRKVLYSARG